MQSDPFVICNNLVKIYKVADLEVVALQGLDLQVSQGEMMALVGASGSGKSTLLNVIGGLDTPNAGDVRVSDHNLLEMDNRHRERYKRDTVGFLWQQGSRYHMVLLEIFSILGGSVLYTQPLIQFYFPHSFYKLKHPQDLSPQGHKFLPWNRISLQF